MILQFSRGISALRAGPQEISDRAAPTNMTSAATQNGAMGTNAKSEPALIDPSACPRLLAAACWPSNAPGAAEWISSNSYDKTGPIIPIEVATIAIISPSDTASGVYEVNASAKAELTKAAAIKLWSIWLRTDEKSMQTGLPA